MSPPAPTPIVKNLAILLAGLLLFLIILFMPLPEGMTESGRRLLAIVGLMGVWWMGEATSITVTALLPLVLFPLFGVMSSKEVASKYINHLIFLSSSPWPWRSGISTSGSRSPSSPAWAPARAASCSASWRPRPFFPCGSRTPPRR